MLAAIVILPWPNDFVPTLFDCHQTRNRQERVSARLTVIRIHIEKFRLTLLDLSFYYSKHGDMVPMSAEIHPWHLNNPVAPITDNCFSIVYLKKKNHGLIYVSTNHCHDAVPSLSMVECIVSKVYIAYCVLAVSSAVADKIHCDRRRFYSFDMSTTFSRHRVAWNKHCTSPNRNRILVSVLTWNKVMSVDDRVRWLFRFRYKRHRVWERTEAKGKRKGKWKCEKWNVFPMTFVVKIRWQGNYTKLDIRQLQWRFFEFNIVLDLVHSKSKKNLRKCASKIIQNFPFPNPFDGSWLPI